MATEIKIPTLGESISSGILATWLVADGDVVQSGEPIYELETDKINQEGLAEVAGKIQFQAQEGDEVAVGQVVATIDESVEAPAGDDQPAPEPGKEKGASEGKEVPAQKSAEEKPVGQQSPAVRRIEAESGLSADKVEGTGKGGRVTKGDMMGAIENAKKGSEKPRTAKEEAPRESVTHAPGGDKPITRMRMTSLRKRIAQRLVESQNQAAILSTFNEADMSEIMRLRNLHKDAFLDKHGVKLGFMSFFVKAVVYALKEVPHINSLIEEDELIVNHYYDIGIAVGTDKGLIVPVLRDCDKMSFADIEKQVVAYGKKAREGKITLDDLRGGVFTISNGGVYGSLLSTPIINPPQSGILGMHAIQERPIAVKGEVVIRPMMYLALSYDHRIVDGKEAVTFLVHVKRAIEDPTTLLFDL